MTDVILGTVTVLTVEKEKQNGDNASDLHVVQDGTVQGDSQFHQRDGGYVKERTDEAVA
jgi:hypothetical protein